MSSSRTVSLLVMGVLLWAVAGVAQESDGQADGADLGAEILRDKYILGLSQALKAEDYPKALGFIEKLDAVGGDLPPAVEYFRGEAYFHTGRYAEANRALNRYVAQTGREGRYYQKSLELMLVVEEKIAAAEREEARRAAEAQRLAEQRRQVLEKLVMVRVEGGSFIMGCQSGRDDDCDDDDEKPAHRVEVGSFEIGKHEVTQALWETVMGENPSTFEGCAECPVEEVSWDDVQRFLAELNALTGRRYRLPTEAEWEYAARGGRQSRDYEYAGSNDVGAVGWYEDNSGDRTHPVGRKRANELGLHDMSGNVREWVQDCWNDSYHGAPADGRAWERGDCGRRVVRGGSWFSKPRWLRSADRYWSVTGDHSSLLGFRLTRTLTP